MTEPITFTGAPISIYQTEGMNGGPSRRVFVTITDLNAVPDELFAVKISQSKNPELSGKPVFKYFSYKVNENAPFSTVAPTGTTPATPTAETKAAVIANLGQLPDAKFSLTINMNGKFGNIKTPEGTYTIFDDEQFPDNDGRPNYYLKSGTIADVELTLATGNYGNYYRVALSTNLGPDDIFVRAGKSKVWGADGADTGADAADDAEETNTGAAW